MQDPDQNPAQSADDSATVGEGQISGDNYVIEIRVKGGQFSVSVEAGAEEDQEESSGGDDQGGGEEDSQAVPNIRALHKLIDDIVNNAGQMADAGADDSAMDAGYSGSQS
jgi:hypothetical protein